MTAPSDDAIGELHAAIATLRAERDAAVARETALVEVLAVINRFPGDPGPVFDAILEKAHRVCGAAVGALMTYDGRHFRAMATQGYPEQYEAWVRRSLTPYNYHRALLRGERLVHVPDVQAEDWALMQTSRVSFSRLCEREPCSWCRCGRTAHYLVSLVHSEMRFARSRA